MQAPPPIEIRYNSGELHSRIAIAVAGMWKQALGIDTTLRAEEFKVLLQDIERGGVQVFRGSWLADYDDAFSFLQVLQGGSAINAPHYVNAHYDELLGLAAVEVDVERRRALLQEAEGVMIADQPLIPLVLLRLETPGQCEGGRLARQCHERRLQQAADQGLIESLPEEWHFTRPLFNISAPFGPRGSEN